MIAFVTTVDIRWRSTAVSCWSPVVTVVVMLLVAAMLVDVAVEVVAIGAIPVNVSVVGAEEVLKVGGHGDERARRAGWVAAR